jgi:hypothetical protein
MTLMCEVVHLHEALDRARPASVVDGKTARLGSLDLRQGNPQNTVTVGCLGCVGVHRAGQRHVAPERPIGALNEVAPIHGRLAIDALFSLHGEDVAAQLELEVRAAEPRRLDPHDDLVLPIDDVGGHEGPTAQCRQLLTRIPALGSLASEVRERAAGAGAQLPPTLGQRRERLLRVVPDLVSQIGHGFFPFRFDSSCWAAATGRRRRIARDTAPFLRPNLESGRRSTRSAT